MIEITVEQRKIYIIPVYINCNKWAQDFSSLYNFLLEFEKEDLMIIGDFNGRVGNSQMLNEEPEFLTESIKNVRSATDEVLDGNGKKLVEMCESIGLTLLNGRTNDDTNGNFTFIRGTACSTIDYCLAKGMWLIYISDFKVNELTYSDHLPLSVQVDFKLQQDSQPKQQHLLPKLRWYEKDLQRYTANLNHNVSLINETDLRSLWGTDILTSCIMESAKPLQKKTVIIGKQPWYDWECESARKKSFAFLRLLRRCNSNHAKNMYREANKNYKILCAQKQKPYSQSLSSTLVNIKDSRSF